MAISKNPLMKGVTGSINKQIVYRELNGRTIISAYPDFSNRIPSAAQVRQNNRLKQANLEVRMIKADEEKRNAALIRLNVQRNRLHHALLSEILLRLGKES